MKKLTTLIFLFVAMPAFAGKISIQGMSKISKAPEFYEFNVSLTTKCFDSASSSTNEITKLSGEIQDVIKQNISLVDGDDYFVAAGITTRKREVTYEPDPRIGRNRMIVLCEKGWTSNRLITVRFSNLQSWDQLNTELLDKIDLLEATRSVSDKQFVVATMGSPVPKLKDATIKQMKKQGLKEALIDASDKFQLIKLYCDLKNASIVGLSESSPIVRTRGRNMSPDEVSTEQLKYDDLSVHLSWNITWEFENTSGECHPETSSLGYFLY